VIRIYCSLSWLSIKKAKLKHIGLFVSGLTEFEMEIKDYKLVGVTKTQASIVNVMQKLLQNYSLQALPITTICMEADVGRATFYRHFDSKEEIIKVYLRVITDRYFSVVQGISDLTLEKLAKTYFEYWSTEKDFIDIVYKNNIPMLLLEETQHTKNHIQASNSNVFPQLSDGFTEIENYYFHSFYFAGFWRLTFLWASRNYQETVEEMTALFLKIHNAK
jgi:AcrR family transcriptional regulator